MYAINLRQEVFVKVHRTLGGRSCPIELVGRWCTVKNHKTYGAPVLMDGLTSNDDDDNVDDKSDAVAHDTGLRLLVVKTHALAHYRLLLKRSFIRCYCSITQS